LKIVCRCIDDEDRYQGVSFVEVDGSLESVGERRLAECGADVAAVTALNCETAPTAVRLALSKIEVVAPR